MKPKLPWELYPLLALLLLLGISGIGGGLVLMLNPDGVWIHMPVAILKGSAFGNFLVPGMALFLVVGVLPVFTFGVLLGRPGWKWLHFFNLYSNRYVGWQLAVFTGLGLLIFLTVEVAVIGGGSLLQTGYNVLGLLILIFTLTPAVIKYYTLVEEDVPVKKECTCNKGRVLR